MSSSQMIISARKMTMFIAMTASIILLHPMKSSLAHAAKKHSRMVNVIMLLMEQYIVRIAYLNAVYSEKEMQLCQRAKQIIYLHHSITMRMK